MIERLPSMWPEIVLFAATCVVMVMGLSRQASVRKLCGPLCLVAMLGAGALAVLGPEGKGLMPALPPYGKGIALFVGALLLLLLNGVVDRDLETTNAKFDPLRSIKGEFHAFFLFSMTGLLLCAGADNLIWLFLALELTSLPTYVMVAVSGEARKGDAALESAVKYFFLGALGAAMFLFGFAFLYGATGTVDINQIGTALQTQRAAGGMNGLALIGVVMSILGLCFKIAAVPMHFYVADVYQGAASAVTAMLAFVPKAAGFFALILILAAVGWGPSGLDPLPSPILELLTVIAVLTMTVGNVLALLQKSVKRMLAYSSIAHSGYMLVGLIAGPNQLNGGSFLNNGIAAVLFYLLIYGVTSVGAFAVLAHLERHNPDGTISEADHFSDIRGLRLHHPAMAWILAFSALGLMGFPPLVGFFAKLPLFTSSWAAGQWGVLLIMAINSAIGAYYYLHLVYSVLLDSPADADRAAAWRVSPFSSRMMAGVISVAVLVILMFRPVTDMAFSAGRYAGTGALKVKRAAIDTPRTDAPSQ